MEEVRQVVASDVVLGPVQAAVAESPAEAAAEEESSTASFGVTFTGLVDTSDITLEALIDEPVASGGDSSLWVGDGDGADDDDDGDEP